MADWVIVIDADEENRKTVSEALSGAGMKVTGLNTGVGLLPYMQENGRPDLILMDVNLPEVDGFELLKLVRGEISGKEEIPVIFLTAEENREAEIRGLEKGVADFISRPFDPEVLVRRARKAMDMQRRMLKFERDAETDQLTGFMNKFTAEERLTKLCRIERGLLCVIDLDSFKSINDLYGHAMGDRILVAFARLLEQNRDFVNECGRIGGDEFVIFARHMTREEDLTRFSDKINKEFDQLAKELLGDHIPVPVGVSIGAVPVPKFGRQFSRLFRLADQALYFVKENGKHGCRLYGDSDQLKPAIPQDLDLETITSILEERNDAPNAVWMGREVFGSIYRYMVRYMDRYHGSAFRVLLTLKINESYSQTERAEIVGQFREVVRSTLRNSDVMMECGEHQFFLLLPEIQENDVNRVVNRVIEHWEDSFFAQDAEVSWETGRVHLRYEEID